MLRTWAVRLPAMKLTLSVRSFHTPATAGTCAWPPSLPSVPTSRATRVTSRLKARSWLTIVLTIRAVSRNCPCKRRPSMSIGTVCERSPWATALMTRAISVLGRTTSSIRSLIAVATLPACPVDVTGMRTVKSPRLTAVRTRSITLGSVLLAARVLLAIVVRPLLFLFLSFSRCRRWSLRGGHPEFDLCSRPRLADDAAPAARELGSFLHGQKSQMAGHVEALADHEAGAVIGDLDDKAAVKGRSRHADARRVGVLFHVGERLGHVLEDDRFQLIGKVIGKAEIDVGFNAAVDAHPLDAISDCLIETDREVESGRAHRGQKPAQGILDLLDCPR